MREYVFGYSHLNLERVQRTQQGYCVLLGQNEAEESQEEAEGSPPAKYFVVWDSQANLDLKLKVYWKHKGISCPCFNQIEGTEAKPTPFLCAHIAEVLFEMSNREWHQALPPALRKAPPKQEEAESEATLEAASEARATPQSAVTSASVAPKASEPFQPKGNPRKALWTKWSLRRRKPLESKKQVAS